LAQTPKYGMLPSPPDPHEKTPSWLAQRQAMVWEPELLISGIVLFGLLQIPSGLDNMLQYLNDWGASILLFSNLDEYLASFLKTSVYLLIVGLIVNILLRSVWVVMIGLSYTLPEGINIQKLSLQAYYANKLSKIPSYAIYIIRIDKLASTVYSLTFLLFMCLIGFSFFFLIYSGLFITLIQIPLFRNQVYPGSWINTLFSTLLICIGGIYLLDFLTLGWLKKYAFLNKVYRPVYIVMSMLTLAPVYRNIYYGVISRFDRWKIITGLIVYLVMVSMLTQWQMGNDSLLNMSAFYKKTHAANYDGYYRDKDPEKISNWLHIPSAQVRGPVLEFFIAHKAALEDSIIVSYTRNYKLDKAQLLASDSLILNALSEFYRFKLNGEWLEPIPMTFMSYSRYNQRGVMGFIEMNTLNRGAYRLELWLKREKPLRVAGLSFYKVDEPEKKETAP
jgi:hypothetical protein